MEPAPDFAEICRWFGANVCEARIRAGLTQAQLSEHAEVSLRYLQAIERGRRAPSFMVMVKLAAHLSVQPARLLEPAEPIVPRRGRPPGPNSRR